MAVLEPKAVLHRSLQTARDVLVWRLDGLTERETDAEPDAGMWETHRQRLEIVAKEANSR